MSRHRPSRKLRHYDDLAILHYIDSYQQAHGGRSPSQRRITVATRLSAPSVAHTIVHRLIGEGMLTMAITERGWPAELTITETGRAALLQWRLRQQPRPATDETEPGERPDSA